MPDLDLATADGPVRIYTLLHDARPVLLNLGEPGGLDIAPWADRVRLVDAGYDGTWKLPVLEEVTAPTAVMIRPDGYVAWVGEGGTQGARRRAHHVVRAGDCAVAHGPLHRDDDPDGAVSPQAESVDTTRQSSAGP